MLHSAAFTEEREILKIEKQTILSSSAFKMLQMRVLTFCGRSGKSSRPGKKGGLY